MRNHYEVTVTFTLTDGRELQCEYTYWYDPGVSSGPADYCYAPESDSGEPTYKLDGVEVDVKNLPKGLDTIAEAMFNDGESDGRFNYREREVKAGYDDYEPDWD